MKSFVAIAVVALFAVASGTGISNRNLITDIIKGLIEKNRGKLANLNVPNITLGEFGSVTNLTIVGAEQFVLVRLDSDGPLSVDIKNATITLETASATASFDFKNVEIPELGLTVNGAGSLSGSIENLFATVSLDLKLQGVKPVLLDFADLYISIEKLSAELTGIDDAENVNAIINSKLVGYLNTNLVLLAEANKAVIIEEINKVIDGIVSH